jgi:carbon-monoxide dehydrogenase medium subunit
MTNLSDTPIWSEAAGAALASGDVEGCVAAAMAAIAPQEDMRGPISFKKHVAEVILRRAIAKAQERAK